MNLAASETVPVPATAASGAPESAGKPRWRAGTLSYGDERRVELARALAASAWSAALRASVQASVEEAHDRSAKVLDAAERVIDRSYQANLQAARDGAAKAVAGLQDEVRQAANRMRLEALKGSRQALYWSGGVFAVAGGLVALGALLGVLGHLWLQGRADARAFGEHPGIFCEGAGGTVVTNDDGSSYCAFWITHPSQLRK